MVKQGFSTHEEIITVGEPGSNKKISLDKNVAYLTINTYANAKIYINNKLISERKKIVLQPMLAMIRVVVPKARPLEKQVLLKRNEHSLLDLFPDVQKGTIQIAVTPFDAQIELSGDAGKHYINAGSFRFENIPAGDYQLTVSKNGYEEAYQKITLKYNQKINQQVSLEKIKYGEVLITVVPNNAKITLTGENGRQYQLSSERQIRVPFGNYNLSIAGTEVVYDSHEEDIIIKAGEKIERSIELSEKFEYKFKKLGWGLFGTNEVKNALSVLNYSSRSLPLFYFNRKRNPAGLGAEGAFLSYNYSFRDYKKDEEQKSYDPDKANLQYIVGKYSSGVLGVEIDYAKTTFGDITRETRSIGMAYTGEIFGLGARALSLDESEDPLWDIGFPLAPQCITWVMINYIPPPGVAM